MSKAILVIDNPDGCNKCKLQIAGEFCDIRCAATDKAIPIRCKKPKWCPLKEIPEGVRRVDFRHLDEDSRIYINLE